MVRGCDIRGAHRRLRWAAFALAASAALTLLSPPAASAGAARDPGGDEAADISLPPPDGKFFGFNLGAMTPGSSTYTPKEYAAQAARVGANMLRNSLSWRRVESQRDVWDEPRWSEYKKIYSALRARGITPLFTFGWAPRWARDKDEHGDPLCTGKCPPSERPGVVAEWREFVAEAARRMPRAAFSTWNEPNLAASWSGGDLPVDPERYGRLAINTYEAIKSVAPSAPVVAGGLATRLIREPSPDMAHWLFLYLAYGQGLKGKADGIDFHVYPKVPRMGAGTRFARIFADIRLVKAYRDDWETPLWVTEFGWTTSGNNALSKAQQADGVLRALRRVLTMSDVRTALVHRLDDNPAYHPSHAEYGYGLLRDGVVPLQPKAAYCGLVAEAETSYPFCSGAVPPDTIIDSAPTALHISREATFVFSSTEEWASFNCALDAGPFERCSSPLTYEHLGSGEHRFEVRAVDPAGLADPTPAVHDFRVDSNYDEVPGSPWARGGHGAG